MALSVRASGKGVQVGTHTPPVLTVRLPLSAPSVDAVLQGLEIPLHPTAQRVYRTLHSIAVLTAQAKAQALTVSQVVIHQPVELLALHLGMSRVTFYKHLVSLRKAELVASRGHVSSYGGLARKDGTLFAVALKPGHRARLRYEDLKHPWRDLAGDIASGTRTAWAILQGLQSKSPRERVVTQSQLVAWAVNPGKIEQNPAMSDCKAPLSETVYSLPLLAETHPKERAALVDSCARALAYGFLDAHNLNFWRKLLWESLHREYEGLDTLRKLANALTRLSADIEEWKGLRSPGALLVFRLRESGLWDMLRHT